MERNELKRAITARSNEFESATESGKPHLELLKIYKELKELQFQLVQLNLEQEVAIPEKIF